MTPPSYEDRNHERRKDDDRLAVRLASDMSQAWNQIGKLKKTLVVAGLLVSTVGGIGAAGAAYGMVREQFEDIPQRVDVLEDSLFVEMPRDAERRDRQIRQNRQSIDDLQAARDSLDARVEHFSERLREIRHIAVSNNCWIRVAAGERSRFDCTPGSPGE